LICQVFDEREDRQIEICACLQTAAAVHEFEARFAFVSVTLAYRTNLDRLQVAVSMLVPVVFAVGLYARRRSGAARDGSAWSVLPGFLLAFVALVVLNSAGAVPRALASQLGQVSRWCLVIAIAALGVRTSLGQLAALGWRPFAVLVVETLWLAGTVLMALHWLPPGTSG